MTETLLTNENVQEIIRLYTKEKISLHKIEKQFRISDSRLKRILKENDIHIRSHQESKKIYEYNENYFDTIDTPDKAYWLGFIYADGYITKYTHGSNVFGITLAEIEPLEKLNKCMESNMRIRPYTKTGGFKTESTEYKLTFCNDKLVSDLEK